MSRDPENTSHRTRGVFRAAHLSTSKSVARACPSEPPGGATPQSTRRVAVRFLQETRHRIRHGRRSEPLRQESAPARTIGLRIRPFFWVVSTRPSSRLRDLSLRTRSNDNRLLVFAEDSAQRVGDFADCSVSFDGGEDRWEEILVRGCAPLQLSQRSPYFRGVTPPAECVKARHLRAFDFGVDTQSRNRAVVFRNEVVDANDNLLLPLDCALKVER